MQAELIIQTCAFIASWLSPRNIIYLSQYYFSNSFFLSQSFPFSLTFLCYSFFIFNPFFLTFSPLTLFLSNPHSLFLPLFCFYLLSSLWIWLDCVHVHEYMSWWAPVVFHWTWRKLVNIHIFIFILSTYWYTENRMFIYRWRKQKRERKGSFLY